MARSITLSSGTAVMLPNGRKAQDGDTVILSDGEYAQLSASFIAGYLSADSEIDGGGAVSLPVAVADGGTGSTTASAALTALGAMPKAGGTFTGAIVPAVVTLTYGASVAVNAALGNVFTLTLTGNAAVIGAPSNPTDGQVIRLRVIQGSSGGPYTISSWNSVYDWGGGSAPTLSTAANKVDLLGFEYVASITKWVYLGASFPQGF